MECVCAMYVCVYYANGIIHVFQHPPIKKKKKESNKLTTDRYIQIEYKCILVLQCVAVLLRSAPIDTAAPVLFGAILVWIYCASLWL